MRSIKQTGAFKKDLKRELTGKYKFVLKEEFWDIVNLLANDLPLPEKYKDHLLAGNWQGHGECHIRNDLLLIYLKTEEGLLYLVRLGSHSEVLKK